MGKRTRVVSLLERIYDVESDTAEWLRGIGEAAQAQVGSGLGVISFLYDITKTGHIRVGEHFALNTDEKVAALTRKVTSALDPDYVRATYASNPSATAMTTGSDETRALTGKVLAQFGWHDIFILNGLDPTGHGAYVGISLGERMTLNRRARATWDRVAAHIASAYRLRRAGDARDEAVVSPSGKIEHAIGDAKLPQSRSSLHAAAVAIERARSKRGVDDAEAVDLWQALVAGQWSLVERVEHDGRRFFIVRRNDPEVAKHHRLTRRERQALGFAALGHSNKLIAYELGLSSSTIAGYLASAAEKLGVSTRIELIQVAHAFARK